MQKQSALNSGGLSFSKHESARYEVRTERKTEEQKLDRLRKLLQTKVYAASISGAVRAA